MLRHSTALEDRNEEFNNFLHRVTEVEAIVKNLASEDKQAQEIGVLAADQYLGDFKRDKEKRSEIEKTSEEDIQIRVISNRTVINKRALELMGPQHDSEKMSQEAFMAEVSRDADMRYKDKRRRREHMETLRKQATKAFRTGEYAKALVLYTKAIEQIRDSSSLYLNRALTRINLELYDDAIADARMALRLNESSLKAWLLMAKSHYLKNNETEFEEAIKMAVEHNKCQRNFINDYASKLKNRGQRGVIQQ